ncbi:MAG: hypothetical protein CMJ70_19760 [Planctomycetaceae bacterium]|nr:hypothetical protein [Planctomycetaceae bacterium]
MPSSSREILPGSRGLDRGFVRVTIAGLEPGIGFSSNRKPSAHPSKRGGINRLGDSHRYQLRNRFVPVAEGITSQPGGSRRRSIGLRILVAVSVAARMVCAQCHELWHSLTASRHGDDPRQ